MDSDSSSHKIEENRFEYFFEDYWDIIVGFLAIAISFYFHHEQNTVLSTLFSAIGIGSLSLTVSEIAEILSERISEPYGSFILTFSAVAVEILLLFIILLQARENIEVLDTVKGGIISAVIVDMNVLLGLAVFVGGLKFVEQEHNKETSSAYTTILYVSAMALLVPSLLSKSDHTTDVVFKASYLIATLLFLFYIVIVIFQTKTHTHFFKQTARSRIFRLKRKLKEKGEEDEEEDDDYIFEKLPSIVLIFTIFFLIASIAFSAEIFAKDGVSIAKMYNIPSGIAGLVIAIISVSPEIATAIKAAKNDEIQRVVNIAMGASTVSILLTVPILMLLAYNSGILLTLNFNPLEIGALILTIILVWKTTDEGHTNYFEGISHLMFFIAYAVIAALY